MRYIVTNRPDHFIRLDLHHKFLTVEESLEMLGEEGPRTGDLESTALSAKLGVLWCAQFGTPPTESTPDGDQIIVDTEIPNIPGLWEPVSLLLYKDVLENEKIMWIGHNIVFDMAWLLMELGIRVITVYDTFIADKVLTAGLKLDRGTYVPTYELPTDFAKRKKKEEAEAAAAQHKADVINALADDVADGIITAAEADISLEGQGFDTSDADDLVAPKMTFVLHNLAAVQKRWLGKTNLDKDVRVDVMQKGINTPETLDYAFRDVDADMFRLAKKLYDKSVELGMQVAVAEEQNFVCVAAWMEDCGIHVSTDAWDAKVDEDLAARDAAEQELRKELETSYPDIHKTMFDMNWGSSHQVIQAFKAIGVNVQNPKKEGSFTASAPLLKSQTKKFPIVKTYLEYTQALKQVSTYGRDWSTPVMRPVSNPGTTKGFLFEGNRIHTKTRQLGAATGRISSGGTKSKDVNGKTVYMPFPNIANLPREARTRRCFTATNKNWKMVTADYGGQESVIFADWTQDPTLLNFYKTDGSDMHAFIARLLFDEIPNDTPLQNIKVTLPDLRQKAKAVGFAIQYGGTGHTIAANPDITITLKEGTALYDKYMATFTGVSAHFAKVQAQALKDGYILINPRTGRRRWLDGWAEWKKREAEKTKLINVIGWDFYKEQKAKNTAYYQEVLKPLVSTNFKVKLAFERQALNSPCQGRGSEMTKRAARMFYDRVRKSKTRLKGIKLVNFVYDELATEVLNSQVDWTMKNLKECMEEASSVDLKSIPFIKAEPVAKDHWDH